ncbi:MAG: hypothetical protein ACO3EZ_02170 [Prochlorotrichaceae cyanobacterium]
MNITGNAAAIAGIIPIEAIVLWVWWTRWCKIQISLLRVFLMVTLLNILTSMGGIPFLWNQMMASHVPSALRALPIFAIGTIVAEVLQLHFDFQGEPRDQRPSRRQIWLSVMVANVLSYAFLFNLLIPTALKTDGLSRVSSPYWIQNEIRQQQTLLIDLQTKYYLQHQTFADRVGQVATIPYTWDRQITLNERQQEGYYTFSDRILRSDLAETEMRRSLDRVDFVSTPRRGNGSSQFTGVLFATEAGQLFGGYCRLRPEHQSEPPPNPSEIQLIWNGRSSEIQCPATAQFQWVSRE